MKAICLCAVLNLELEGNNTTFNLTDTISITNDKVKLLDLIRNKEKIDADMGKINLKTFQSCKAFIIGEFPNFKSAHQANSALNAYMSMLWLLDDNSCCIPVGHFYIESDSIECDNLHQNVRDVFISRGNGTYDGDFVLNKGNFSLLLNYIDKYLNILLPSSPKEQKTLDLREGFHIPKFHFEPYSNMSRIQRSNMFIGFARSISFLPAKISLYIGAIECLFSSNENEISYKVASRLSFYLADSNPERRYLFELINDCYSARSKYFHGDEMPRKFKTYEQQSEYSVKLDNVLRTLFNKVLDKDVELFNQPDLTGFHKELLLKNF